MGENHEKWSRVMRAALVGINDQVAKFDKLDTKPQSVSDLLDEVNALWADVQAGYNQVLPMHADDFHSSAPSETKTAGKLAEIATEASRMGGRLSNIESMLKYLIHDSRSNDDEYEDGALSPTSVRLYFVFTRAPCSDRHRC